MGLKATIVTARRIGSDIILWVRSEQGKHRAVVRGFRPYFYIPSKLGSYKSIFGEDLDIVYARDPGDVPRMREKYNKTYEADVPYTRRFFIDKGLYTCVELAQTAPEIVVHHSEIKPCHGTPVKPVVWFLDIEVDSSQGFPNKDVPTAPIIAISVFDGEKYITWGYSPLFKTAKAVAQYDGKPWEVRVFDDEELMLMDFVAEVLRQKPDIIAGWNIYFDHDYLTARLKFLNISYNFEFIDWFDLLLADKVVVRSRRSRILKRVTVEEGFETKQEAKEASDVIPLWRERPTEILKYNVRDVWRIVKLNEKFKYIDLFWAYKEVTGLVHLEDTLFTFRIVDIMVLRTAKKRGVALPTSVAKQKRRYKGAIVLTPKPGIYENVAVFDMSKYYPAIMISFNTSPEVKWKPVDPANGIWAFKHKPQGIIPEAVQGVLIVEKQVREEMKKYRPEDPMYKALSDKLLAIKGVRNSFYGVLGNEHFRLYDPDVASTVTGLGREGILFLAKKAEELGYKTIYGDTDSIFIKVKEFDEAPKLAERLTQEVKRYFKRKYGLPSEPVMELKFEKFYRRILFTEAKKRYAGWLVWKGGEADKIDIVGFEAVRTDTAPFTAYAEEQVFNLILKHGVDYDALNKLVKQLLQEFEQADLDEIALYANLTRPFSEYKNKPPHVRAAMYSNMYLGTNFKPGDKVRYLFVNRVKGLPPTDVIAFEEIEQVRDKVEIDKRKMLDRVLWSPLNRIFKVIGYRYGMRTRKWF